MRKADLIEAVAQGADMSKAEAERAVNALLDSIKDALTAGSEVNISGLGKFEVSERAARTGRNPATGAPIDIPASKTVRFKPAAPFKRAIAG